MDESHELATGGGLDLRCSRNAMYAGFFGSAASVFGKLITHFDANNWDESWPPASLLMLQWSYRVAFMAGMVICNMLVWTNFVKAMHAKDGPIVATVVSAATNYCLSAVMGALIFMETVSLLWVVGVAQVYLGIWYIHKGSQDAAGRSVEADTTLPATGNHGQTMHGKDKTH